MWRKSAVRNLSADFMSFPGSHVAAFTVVLMLALQKGEVSMAASRGD